MDKELQVIVDKKDGGRLTVSVKPHQTKGNQLVAPRNAPLDEDGFLSNVAGAGASAAIVSDPTRAMNSPSDLALLQVQDTLTPLHKLAPDYRQLMPHRPVSPPLPASSRPTTGKEPGPFPASGLRTTRATSVAK